MAPRIRDRFELAPFQKRRVPYNVALALLPRRRLGARAVPPMLPISLPRLPRLAALALILSAGAFPSRAQDTTPPAVAARDQVAAPENSPEALATAARNILELIEVHRFRMRRIDASLAYYRSIGDMDHVRQFSLLREREQSEYQQSLETYRRMLGEKDFTRVAGLLRNYFNDSPERSDAGGEDVRARRDAAADSDESAADRAERVRRLMAAQLSEERERAAQQTAYDRSQAIARARASQRAQLAQRLQQARAVQLEQRAAAVRRYQPPTVPGGTDRQGGAVGSAGSRGSAGPAGTSGNAPSGSVPPPARPAPRPERP